MQPLIASSVAGPVIWVQANPISDAKCASLFASIAFLISRSRCCATFQIAPTMPLPLHRERLIPTETPVQRNRSSRGENMARISEYRSGR
jgi:hypothetical protein